ncbi:MAG: hypothetical protein ABGZ17_25240 [Planctomycetaceae bacterium]
MKIPLTGNPTDRGDSEHLARKSDRFSGADLTEVVDRAIEDKLRLAMQDGILRPITSKILLKSIKQPRASTAEWFSTAKNFALFPS